MINLAYELAGSEITREEKEKQADAFAESLTDILVKSEPMKLLWFFAAESPWELLFKANCSYNNPFSKVPSFQEKALMNVYRFVEKRPIALKLWNRILNNRMTPAATQTYR